MIFNYICRFKEKIEFRDLKKLEEVVSTYSAAQHDIRCLCFSPDLNVLFYEIRLKSRSVIHQLDCSASPATQKNGEKHIETLTVVNEMCYARHEERHLLVTAQRRKNSGVCVYDIQTAELRWCLETFRPNAIPSVAIDGAGNILVCDCHSEEVYRISVSRENMGTVLKNPEKLFDVNKMQLCKKSSSLVLVYKNAESQWCATTYRMDT